MLKLPVLIFDELGLSLYCGHCTALTNTQRVRCLLLQKFDRNTGLRGVALRRCTAMRLGPGSPWVLPGFSPGSPRVLLCQRHMPILPPRDMLLNSGLQHTATYQIYQGDAVDRNYLSALPRRQPVAAGSFRRLAARSPASGVTASAQDM